MDAFLSSTFLVAAAEMGDKSQLVALAFATRYSWKVTLAGVTVATLLVHLFSVALGEAAGAMLPTFWIQVAAGVAFIGFGLWTLRGDTYEESDVSRRAALGPFATVAMAFFLSELGDKTMLATVTLAAQLRAALGVWVGSTLGMVVADAVAVFAGIVMGKNLPQRAIKLGASVVFFVSGAYALAKALGVLA